MKSKDWSVISTKDPYNDLVGNNLKRLDGIRHVDFSDATIPDVSVDNTTTRDDMTLDFLRRELEKLKQAKIACSIAESQFSDGRVARAILGEFNNDPFCVYMKWCMRKDGEFMAVVVTRYKGNDYPGIPPKDVLK